MKMKKQKKTKIVCTIGPACASEETLTKMIQAGMDVARLNFSHGTHETHRQYMDAICAAREKLGAPLPVMLDTKGPEYRIGVFAEGSITVNAGDSFTFTADDVVGDSHRVSVSYKDLPLEVNAGERILVNNGLVVFEVERVEGSDIVCKALEGGVLSDRKSMSFPNKVLKGEYLSEADKSDILFGIEIGVDFIACSFVSCAQDLISVRDFIKENGGSGIDLIAKIENRAGVDNIKEILEASDGIMIGRGDMGVEIPYEELPAIQKKLIHTCSMMGKRVITATEMLESMINNPRPTRAEISDVANAVYDGTSAIMLSGETAAGKHPVEAVSAMARIASETESDIDYVKRFRSHEFITQSTLDAISHSTVGVAADIDASLLIICTRTGKTARMVSRFRPSIPIIGMTTDRGVWRKLAMSWGVVPVMSEVFSSTDVIFYHALAAARSSGLCKAGDNIVITAGAAYGNGNTNLIKIETLPN